MSWQLEVEQTVTGLGYALVDAERSANGTLQVFIEHPGGEAPITVDDCERVTRQLQYVLEVADIDYPRLEVSSPGLDRPLKRKEDFDRFVGALVEVVFKQPVEIQTGSKPYQQKKFQGRLEASVDDVHDWMLILGEEGGNDKKRGSKKQQAQSDEPVMALGFTFAEVRDAKLVPVIDFKAKKKAAVAEEQPDAASEL